MRLVVEIPAHIEYLEYLGQLKALGDACSLLEPPDQETVDMIRLLSVSAQGGLVDGFIRCFRYSGPHRSDHLFHLFLVGYNINVITE